MTEPLGKTHGTLDVMHALGVIIEAFSGKVLAWIELSDRISACIRGTEKLEDYQWRIEELMEKHNV